MFEAHLDSYSEAVRDESHLSQRLSPSLDEQHIECILENHKHQSSCWVWSAHGKRKNHLGTPIPTIFLYIEYRDTSNIARYICQEVEKTANIDQQYLQLLATSLELPEIDPNATKKWLS